ncbi:RagB/SusD family nutrient uptake outer membrane protein [Mucilaginibacter sp. AW1-3]
MHKKIIYRSVLVLTLVLSCSCNKYLTLYPQDGTTRQAYWQNKEQLQSAVIGIYSSLIQGTPTDIKTPNKPSKDPEMAELLFTWGELRADNVAGGGNSTDGQVNILNESILSTNSYVNWGPIYRTINFCNNLLKYAPGVSANDPTLTTAQLNSYMAEALTIRALMYLYLVKTFGDVPIKLTPTATDNDLVLLAKSPQKDVIAQILADLKTAEASAVRTYGNQASDKGRITLYTVYAIEADTYLWNYDYANCIAACDKIINSGNFGLIAGNSNFFNLMYANGNSNESIFEFQYDGSTTQNNPFYGIMGGAPASQLMAQGNVIGTLFPVDPFDDKNVDIRSSIAVNSGTGAIWKYVGTPGSSAQVSATTTFRHWIVYRYAEILFMKAEACAWIGGRGTEALSLVLQIKQRANSIYVQGLSLDYPDPTDALAVTNYILDEKNREFIYEGKRWYDLLRNAKRNFPANLNILTDALALVLPPAYQQTTLSKFRDINSLYLPIPNGDILLDPNLVQNPFYK